MLNHRQILVCATLGALFWLLATLYIHLLPLAVSEGIRGDIGFVATIPVCWLCVWLTCRLARLGPTQILAGCVVAIGDAMLIDGIAVRWFHALYTQNDAVNRLGAAWLLWGYGLSAWIALLVAMRRNAMQPADHPASAARVAARPLR